MSEHYLIILRTIFLVLTVLFLYEMLDSGKKTLTWKDLICIASMITFNFLVNTQFTALFITTYLLIIPIRFFYLEKIWPRSALSFFDCATLGASIFCFFTIFNAALIGWILVILLILNVKRLIQAIYSENNK